MWLANIMATWVTAIAPKSIFDPAVGPGTFYAAAIGNGFKGKLLGHELHQEAFLEGESIGLALDVFKNVTIGDFITSQSTVKYPAIISNPPYMRHHRLGAEYKVMLSKFAIRELGFPLDGRVGLHVYFLIKCLSALQENGRLVFLLPADVCEGVSANKLWVELTRRYRLNAVLTFSAEAAPFPKVDTNAMVFFMSKEAPQKTFVWIKATGRNQDSIQAALDENFTHETPLPDVERFHRNTAEGVATGLSRPLHTVHGAGLPLSRFAKVMRGIATGENSFFHMTQKDLVDRGLPKNYFTRAISRTRDCKGSILTINAIEELDKEDRPTWLLTLGKVDKESLPKKLREYLVTGEVQGLHERSLIKTRRPWYKMEHRTPPPLLFAYLGRRECRFIKNMANVVPLTGFLCVYPHDGSADNIDALWRALNSPATLDNLKYVGKSYGDGSLKVEPGPLADLIIPNSIIEEFDLTPTPTESLLELETN